jgi:hypothetical protein
VATLDAGFSGVGRLDPTTGESGKLKAGLGKEPPNAAWLKAVRIIGFAVAEERGVIPPIEGIPPPNEEDLWKDPKNAIIPSLISLEL